MSHSIATNGTPLTSARPDSAIRRSPRLVSITHGGVPPRRFRLIFSPLINLLCSSGEMTIFNMREKRPAYNLLDNNCQNFALNFLDKIRVGKHRDFATSFNVYQRAIGAGAIKDLFVDGHPDDKPETADEDAGLGAEHHDTVQTAEQIMDENTTKLDNHHSFFQ